MCLNATRRVLLVQLVLVAAAAGCGRDSATEAPPLTPPALEKDGAIIEWRAVATNPDDTIRATATYRLVLETSGAFTYAWTTVEDARETAQEVRGCWRALKAQEWSLEPDEGRTLLHEGEFPDGEFPTLRWHSEGVAQGLGRLGAVWMVPALLPSTGRFLNLHAMVPDARLLRHASPR
jgi:hypothetical protein